MDASVKIQGTKYFLKLSKNSSNEWFLSLIIDNAEEDFIEINTNSMRAITEGVDEILKKNSLALNDFVVSMIIKELYKETSGDTDLKQHTQDMKEIKDKKNLMQNEEFKDSLVSEFKESFNIKQEVPKKINTEPKSKKQKNDKKEKSDKKKKKEKEQLKPSSGMRTGLTDIVSEIDKNIEEASQPNIPVSKSSPAGRLTQSYDPVDTRVTSVDIEDLINELNDTKEQLRNDLDRVYMRIDKIDKIILKISSVGSKL